MNSLHNMSIYAIFLLLTLFVVAAARKQQTLHSAMAYCPLFGFCAERVPRMQTQHMIQSSIT